MTLSGAARRIRDLVSMDQVLAFYGYRPNRHGTMVCPFHGDHDPSLKIYQGSRGWYCYGCGRGGSVIDFVMAHESCSFRTAVLMLDRVFSLGLTEPGLDPEEDERERKWQAALDAWAGAAVRYCGLMKRVYEEQLRQLLKKYQEAEEMNEKYPMRMGPEQYAVLTAWKEDSEYTEFKISQADQLIREVKEWRRKAGRVRLRW